MGGKHISAPVGWEGCVYIVGSACCEEKGGCYNDSMNLVPEGNETVLDAEAVDLCPCC